MEKAVLSLAASAMSPIFSSLADKGASYFGGDVTEEEITKLKCFVIPNIRAAIGLAEGIHVDHVHKLKEGLMRLRAAAYEADDVLDMYEYKRLKAQHRVSFLPGSIQTLLSGKAKNLFAPFKLKTKLKRRMEGLLKTALEEADKLISIAEKLNSIAAPKQVNQQQPPPTTVSTPPPQVLVLGRDGERDFLVDVLISSLLPAPGHVPVVAIHGIGGAGKTTLAQHVYNDPRVAQHFLNNRMWVHVSNHFDERMVTREIIESVTGNGNHNNIISLNVLQQKLKDVLKSKRFLLVLDDVWCDDKVKWDQMLIPLNENGGDMGSRILVTTRTQEVASKLGVDKSIPLKELQSTDYWSIFKHYAFGDANNGIDDPALLEIAEQIVKKLSKSPLAARMVGSLLNRNMSTADSWKNILKQQNMLNDTFDALLLSFQHLPLPLQQCFAFCSLYPKGRRFADNGLIRLWIAQGFVDAHDMNNMTIEEKGQQYFKDLVAHSFFQEGLYGKYGIHDLLHDLAEKVSKDHCLRIEGGETISIPPTILHLSISTRKLSIHMPKILKLVNLRTFINLARLEFDEYDVDFNVVITKNNMFKKLRKLRVFDAGSYSMGSYPNLELHSSIGELKHLRFLKFQPNNVKKLPESIATLYHLQYVIVYGYGSNMVVPKDFHKLINLRFLESADDMLSRIQLFGHLTSLQQLRVYRATRSKNCEIGQLKNLQELHGSLTICGLQNVKDKTEAAEASLKDKSYLDKLLLEWSDGVGRDGSMEQEVLEGLEPPHNLKYLKIEGYLGVGSPRWMLNNSKSLSKLHTLKLSRCTKLCTVPPLGQLPLLTELRLSSMPLVKEIGPDFYGGDDGELGGVRFPRLEILQFHNMENWMHWYGAADGVQLFPCLQQLSMHNCPDLLQLPCVPHTLKVVHIYGCEKLSGKFSLPYSLEELDIDDWPGFESLMPCGDDDHQEEEQAQAQAQHKSNYPNQVFSCLRKLTISRCSNLVQIPYLPPTLQELRIYDCRNLYGVRGPLPQSLTSLEVKKCPKLMQLSPFHCHGEEMKMEGLPAGVEDMPQQQQLAKEKVDPDNYSLVSVSVSVSEEKNMFKCPDGFTSLSRMVLVGLPCLTSVLLVPNLPAMEYLKIEECKNLESIGSSLSSTPSLKIVHIANCPNLVQIPSLPPTLQTLRIYDCRNLYGVRGPLPQSLTSLNVKNCPKLMQLSPFLCCHGEEMKMEGLPAGVEDMPQQLAKEEVDPDNYSLVSVSEEKKMFKCPDGFTSLSELVLVGLPCLTSVLLVPNLPALEYLIIKECENLESIGSSLSSIPSLEMVHISNCSHLRSLLEQSDLRSLKELVVGGCPQLTSLGNSQSLSYLSVRRCPRLEIGGGGGGGKSTAACFHFPSLEILNTDDISILAPLIHSQGLSNSLRRLTIRDCTQDIGFTPEQEKLFQKLTSLDSLSFLSCPNLPSLPVTLKNLTSLASLLLGQCPKIESLPNLSASLVKLRILHGCHEQLRVKYGEDGPLRHTIRHIPEITIRDM